MKRGIIWAAVSSERQVDEISLDEQERTAREFAAANNIQIVAAIRWEGYSRYETDIELALEDFARRGHLGYHQLRDMWRQRAFDVLICYHDSRLGRRTLYNWVVDNVIASGAQIYRIQGGWITAKDATVQTALGIIATRSETERFVELSRRAKDKRASDGTYINSKMPFSHMAIRDNNHKVLQIVVNEAHRWIIEEAARLLVTGIGFNALGDQLHRRGILNPITGKHFSGGFFYMMFYNPYFWGTQARRWRQGHGKFGTWAFDPDTPAPEGALVYYNRHPPALTGELAERVKAELRRRERSVRGGSRPQSPSRFSGLLICGYCGYRMAYSTTPKTTLHSHYYRCQTRYAASLVTTARLRECTSTYGAIRETTIFAWFDAALRRLLEVKDINAVIANDADTEAAQQLAAAEARIARIETEVRALIAKQSAAADTLATFYDERLAVLAAELDGLKIQVRGLNAQLAAIDSGQKRAVEALTAAGTVDKFWELPDKEVNQILDALLGSNRLVVKDGAVVGAQRV